MPVHGLFDGDVLVATAALLTDGLTKAVLVDVAVVADRRGRGLGDEVVRRVVATIPDGVDDSYSLMLRR